MREVRSDTRTIDDLQRQNSLLKVELAQARLADQGYQNLLVAAEHELRSPLNALGLHLTYLARISLRAKDPELTSHIQRTERLLHAYVDRIRALLDVGRISAGVFTLKPTPVLLSELVALIVELHEANAEYQGVDIHADLEPGLNGEWDRAAVEAIVSNLLSNALKYAAGAPVAIQTRTDGLGNAIIRVADHGPGIEEHQRCRIFEKFARGVGPESTVGGFGLGLWIARQLALLHGGSVAIEPASGSGSVFVVTLPLTSISAITSGRLG